MTATYIAIGAIALGVVLVFWPRLAWKMLRSIGTLVFAVVGGCIIALTILVEEWLEIWMDGPEIYSKRRK